MPCARVGPPGVLVLAFQPHRYTRTRDLLDDFGRVLANAMYCWSPKSMQRVKRPSPARTDAPSAGPLRTRGLMEPVFVERVDDLADRPARCVA